MVDAWTREPVAQEYPYQASDGLTHMVDILKGQADRLREVTSNLFRTAGLRALPGKIASLDFDGTDRTHLGTAGWMLGGDAGGPSYLALNGRDIIADLSAADAAFAAQDALIAAQVASIAALVGQQVTISTMSASANNFAVGTGWGSFAAVTFSAPAGFSNVSIQANGAASLYYTGGANPEEMRSRMMIGGSAGGELAYMVDTSSVGSRITSAAGNHSASIGGLTAGATISVYLGMHSSATTWPANGYNAAVVSATATFTR